MKALLFDLDGTLVDSIPLWIAANLEELKKRGVTISTQQFLTDFYHHGLHYHGIVEKCGFPLEQADQYYRDRNARFETFLREKVEWLDDAGTMLKKCAKKLPLGLLTGASRRAIEAMDVRLQLLSLFTVIITYDETGLRMKPDPYGLFLLTEKLKVNPHDCAYVGDQYVDVQAARAAGMQSWLIPTENTPPNAAAEADLVLQSIADMPLDLL